MHYAWVITFTGILVFVFSQGFGKMAYPVILPSMKEGLSLTYTQIGLIGTGNFIGYLVLAIVAGFLTTRFGARKVIFLSLLVMGVGLFLTGSSDSFSFAFVTRLITGIGNGGAPVPMITLPVVWFVAKKRGLAMGIINMGVGLGLSLSGLILPYCISGYGQSGWRYAWHLMGITVFAGSFLCYALLRDHPEQKGLTMYGGHGEPARVTARIPVASAVRQVVGESEIWKLGCVYFMFGFSYIIYLTFFIAHLTTEIGMQTAEAGRIFAVLGLFSIFCGLPWGSISDVAGRRYASIFAYLILGVAFLLFALCRETSWLYVSGILFGVTAFAVPVIMAAAVGDAVGGQLAPAGFGFLTLFFGSGQAFGPFVGGLIKDTTGTFTYAFALCTVVALLGAFCSFFLRKKS
jgi:MFS family permease